MLLDRYGCKANESYSQYEFKSEGPNGMITKRVLYQYMETIDYVDHYNLTVVDVDNKTGELSDLRVSNNRDRHKILATVAFTAVKFSDHFPGCKIYAKGSTPPRTRLYQMGIAAHFEEINQYFLIKGEYPEKKWVFFRPGYNYEAFLATARQTNTIFN